jgi:LmbE family N-acetylglucosaminyl deacetylase
MNVLVIAPHRDDEVLGCGGTIARLRSEGHYINVLYVTTAIKRFGAKYMKRLNEESVKAIRILGIGRASHLNQPILELNSSLAELIKKELWISEPDWVFLPSPIDRHTDHQKTYEYAMVALRPPSPVKKILCYETITETHWGDEVFEPNMWVDISDTIETKIKAMECYKSQITPFRSLGAVRNLASFRGDTVGAKFAECFHIVREYV